MNETVLGDYNYIPDYLTPESHVNVNVQPIDLMTYWKRCGLMSDFAAAFFAYTKQETFSGVETNPTFNVVSTIVNELVENAAKFSINKAGLISIHLKHYKNILKIEVENETSKDNFEKFQKHTMEILSAKDIEALYFSELEQRVERDDQSGIGLLMLMNDYSVKLGVKFYIIDESVYRICVRAHFYMEHIK